MIKIATLEDRFETDLITGAFDDEQIGYVVKTFHDTAYDGLFETQKGYGLLLVEEEDEAKAREIVAAVRSSTAEE